MPYRLVGVNTGRGQHLSSAYLDINPLGEVPTLTDSAHGKTVTVYQAGAILIYMAEREGRFLPASGSARIDTLQWLMFQVSTVGPMLGQANHFRRSALEPVPYAIERYTSATRRAFQIVDKRLTDREYIAGDYSIADMALFPWLSTPAWFGLKSGEFPHVARWCRTLASRKAVQASLAMRIVAADWPTPSIAV